VRAVGTRSVLRLVIAACALGALGAGALVALASNGDDAPRPLTVYAAASLKDALPALDRRPTYSFAGSNQLQLQIDRGAPADVFASASPTEAQALFRAGRCSRPRTFATNRLALLVPHGNPGHIGSVHRLRSGGRRLAVGNAGVPVGDYTRKLLRRMRLSEVLGRNTVSQEANVAGIVAKVGNRSADAGFAYVTDARAASGRVDAIPLPRRAQPPVRYQACAVRRGGADTAGATRWIARLRGTAGRQVLERFGFGLPPRG
jgi:molybdate transport system substrate-binding protein